MEESKLLYKSFVPLDLKNLYEQIISCESSLGISINSELQNIIKDTVNVFLNASVIPFREIREGIPVLGKLVSYEGVDINFRNLEFHDNEDVNYDTVSRVFNQIFELQETVFNIIVSQDDDDDDDSAVIELSGEEDEIIESLYTGGDEFVLTDSGKEYIGFYHSHPDKGFMVGPIHIDQPHAYLTPLDTNIFIRVNEDPTGGEAAPIPVSYPEQVSTDTSSGNRNRRQNTSSSGGTSSSSGSSGGSY